MNRTWTDFKSLHGNIAGAREAFENACETIYRKKHLSEHVSQMRVKHGNGGIDVFIGEFGVEPIVVIQCKFFLDSFGESQKAQIRDSFDTAINSEKYELKEWILCIPRIIDIDENSWWFKWKHKKLVEHTKENSFIKLTNGNALIDLSKELDLYNQIFEIDDSQKLAEIHDVIVPKKVDLPKDSTPNVVLFNNYTLKSEPFYLERDKDVEFIESLAITNVWLFGSSGVGKTALINRNFITNSIPYCYCDLSPVTITSLEDVLNDILYTIEGMFGVESKSNENNILKQISNLLCDNGSKKFVIVIDELSVDDNKILRDIANSFMQLVNYYTNCSGHDGLRFVISTISNPKDIVQNKSKAVEYFQYICCDSWDAYSSQLFDILCGALKLKLEISKSLIIEKAKHSPRILKAILKKIIILNDSSQVSIDKAIEKTLDEIVE